MKKTVYIADNNVEAFMIVDLLQTHSIEATIEEQDDYESLGIHQ